MRSRQLCHASVNIIVIVVSIHREMPQRRLYRKFVTLFSLHKLYALPKTQPARDPLVATHSHVALNPVCSNQRITDRLGLWQRVQFMLVVTMAVDCKLIMSYGSTLKKLKQGVSAFYCHSTVWCYSVKTHMHAYISPGDALGLRVIHKRFQAAALVGAFLPQFKKAAHHLKSCNISLGISTPYGSKFALVRC